MCNLNKKTNNAIPKQFMCKNLSNVITINKVKTTLCTF